MNFSVLLVLRFWFDIRLLIIWSLFFLAMAVFLWWIVELSLLCFLRYSKACLFLRWWGASLSLVDRFLPEDFLFQKLWPPCLDCLAGLNCTLSFSPLL